MGVLRLLAQADPLRAARQQLGQTSWLAANWVPLAAVAVVILFWVGLYVWWPRRWAAGAGTDDPRSLFLELCRAHRLDRDRCALLWKVAQHQHAEQPAQVFVDPSLLSRYAEEHAGDADGAAALAKRLFGEASLPSPPPW